MKNIIVLFLAALFISSCNNSKNKSVSKLSEPPNEVAQWVKNNNDTIIRLREYFITNIKDKRQADTWTNTLTPNQKRLLWVGKVLEVLKFDWTEQERKHIQSLLEFMIVNPIFEDSDIKKETLVMVNQWGEDWAKYAIENLEWDTNHLYAIAGTWAVMLENKDVDSKFK